MIIHDHKTHEIGINLLKSLDIDKMPGPMELVLKPHKKKRSLNQNDLFWVWCTEFGDHTGNFKDYMYKFFEEEFCPPVTVEVKGMTKTVRCAKKLPKKEFSEFMEKVYYWLEIEQDFKVEWPQRPIETQRNE